jgi:copper transport protein
MGGRQRARPYRPRRYIFIRVLKSRAFNFLQPNCDTGATLLSRRAAWGTRSWVWAIGVALMFVVSKYDIASAHATLVSSEPRAGSWVPTSPASIRLVFSEPIEVSLASISLVSSSGATVNVAAAADPHDVHALIATPSALTPGEYRVVWRIVSADGHPVGGSYVFGVGSPAAGASVPDVAPQPESKVWGPALFGAPAIPAVLRGLGVGCLLALTGLLWFASSSRRFGSIKGIALTLGVAAPVLLAAHLWSWLVNTAPEHHLDAAWISATFATQPGRFELARTLLSIVPIWALALARRPKVGLVGGILALLTTSAVGHSAAIVPQWAIPFKAVHLLALAIWLGGLVWIAARRRDDAADATEVSRVSSAAFWAVVAVALSGVVQTRVLMSTWSDFDSVYGAVVLAKVVGLGALVGFGAYHRRLIRRFVADRGAVAFLRKSVAREIVVFSIVILLAGFLAYLSPPMARQTALSTASHQQ